MFRESCSLAGEKFHHSAVSAATPIYRPAPDSTRPSRRVASSEQVDRFHCQLAIEITGDSAHFSFTVPFRRTVTESTVATAAV